MLAIFKQFFALGWISFGGPAAHIGYFRHTFVEKLHWLNDEEYGQIVALSQFLPGPGSSQVGFALGYRQGGLPGALAAFLGFTLPSVILMLVLALLSSQVIGTPVFESVIHGLKLLAVVVVADATWGMYKNFCQQRLTLLLAMLSALVLLVFPGIAAQMGVLLVAAMLGQHYLQQPGQQANTNGRLSVFPLVLFALLFTGLPLLASAGASWQIAADFFSAGSLVFGGGHVVLPLLQGLVGDQLTADTFLTGYAAAQAIPGPMFTLATYLGYQLLPSAPVWGAVLATLAVFAPGFLLMLGVLKNWQALSSKPRIAGAMRAVNAAVVGLLFSALYQPVFVSAVFQGLDLALVLIGLVLLKQFKLPIVGLVGFFVVAGFLDGILLS